MRALEPGAHVPPFSLSATDGQTYNENDLRGHKTLLVFIRGTWCRHAQRQLAELQNELNNLATVGVTVMAVSTQAEQPLRDFADANGLSFPILIDQDRALTKLFRVLQPVSLRGFRLARPSSFVLSEAGEVLLTHVSRRPSDLPRVDDLYQRLIDLLAARARR